MKTIYSILFLLGAALAGEAPAQAQEQGVCLDPVLMSAICTYNTAIGQKMDAASQACSTQELPAQEERSSSDRENKCDVDFGEIIGFFNNVWAAKACVLRETGWVDENDEVAFENILDDLASLPLALAEGLADTRDLCVNRTMHATLENLLASSEFGANTDMGEPDEPCVPDVTPEELNHLETTLQKLAFFRCIHENFMDGCGNYIIHSAFNILKEKAQ